MPFRVIPAVDLYEGKVVRLKQGRFSSQEVYYKDPRDFFLLLEEKGFSYIHIIDLEGAEKGAFCHWDILEWIKENTSLSFQVGGGIRSKEVFSSIFSFLGEKDRILIGSLPWKDPSLWEEILEEARDFLILSLDVWGRDIKISGWQEDLSKNVLEVLPQKYQEGVSTFLVTQIQKDGLLEGVDISLYKELLQKCPYARIIASGGVSSYEDLLLLSSLSLEGVVVGRALYEGRISLEKVSSFLKEDL